MKSLLTTENNFDTPLPTQHSSVYINVLTLTNAKYSSHRHVYSLASVGTNQTKIVKLNRMATLAFLATSLPYNYSKSEIIIKKNIKLG